MRIVAISTLKAFWAGRSRFRDAEGPVLAWYREAVHAKWAKPADVKAQFRSANILRDGRAMFNVGGNKHRIMVWINYAHRVVYIHFIGTHAQYDAIDAQSI